MKTRHRLELVVELALALGSGGLRLAGTKSERIDPVRRVRYGSGNSSFRAEATP